MLLAQQENLRTPANGPYFEILDPSSVTDETEITFEGFGTIKKGELAWLTTQNPDTLYVFASYVKAVFEQLEAEQDLEPVDAQD